MKQDLKLTLMASILTLALSFLGMSNIKAQNGNNNGNTKTENSSQNENKLVVIWSSDDPMVAKRVALMYSHAAKRNAWFNEVTLVIWGPSAKLIAEDKELQNKVMQMKKDGIIVKACIACANEYGVTSQLKELGYDVIPMGRPLTDYLKNGYKVLTF